MELILDKIKNYQTIIIHRHIRPDGDCMGSQLGLKDLIKKSFPEKQVYAVGEEKTQFHVLGRMDEIDDSTYQDALVFILDVSNKERISDERYLKGKEIIKIDHHPKKSTICEHEWVDTSYASCCEMIVDFYYQNKMKLSLSNTGAQALYFGIVTDTLRFSSPSTNRRTFKLASYLLNYDFDLRKLYQSIYDEPVNVTRLRGFVASNFTITSSGLGYIYLDKKLCEQFNADASITNLLVDVLAHTKQVKIWFVAMDEERTKKVRVSLRSKALRINHIAEKFGGGGHKNACGIVVNDSGIVEKLAKELDQYLSENKK